MELKKSPKADLETKKGMFFQVGLIVSILVIIAVFSYSQDSIEIELLPPPVVIIETEVMEITRQEERPPIATAVAPVQTVSDLLKVVPDDTKITEEIDFAEFVDEAVVAGDVSSYGVGGGVEEVVDDTPFLIVEDMPIFQKGDLGTFRTWVQQRLKYPTIALENSIQGKVNLTFVIEVDGRLTNIIVLTTPDRSLSEEAIRVLKTSPKWTPGKQRGKAVRVKYSLPLEFKIAGR